MSWSLARRLALGAWVASAAACGGTNGDANAPSADVTSQLRFETDGTLKTAPGQTVAVRVIVSGSNSASHRVTFWLVGEYEDGSLDAGQARVDDGRAEVGLRAPSSPATFVVHASIDGAPEAQLNVSVSATGFASIKMNPLYQGKRPAPEAVASVFLKATCAMLAQKELSDGAPLVTGPLTAPIFLESVPAGMPTALIARVGHYASGCVDLEPLVADAVRPVDAEIYDLPMALDRTNLEAVFDVDSDAATAAALQTMLDNGEAKAIAAFLPAASPTEASTLLDAMASAAPDMAGPQFATSRQKGTWDTKAGTWLGSHGLTMRKRVQAWMDAGDADALRTLLLHLDGGGSPGLATVTLESFGAPPAGAPTGDAGLPTRVPFAWVADLSDTVHLQGAVYMRPSAFVSNVADAQAATQVAGASDAAQALGAASGIDCAGLSSYLLGTTGESYPTCGITCTAGLCSAGLAAMWQNARDASATALEETDIRLTMSAHAEVDDHAKPVAFQGTWSAQVTAPGQTFSLKGTANATMSK